MSSVRREDFLSGRAVRYQHRLPGGGGVAPIPAGV